MKGLLRIILINAKTKNRVVQINMPEHTSLCGGNGFGKTTILRLIPLFYGAIPSSLVEKGPNKLPFVDFYLHSDTSYIVYEYISNSTTCCVVCFRHTSGGKLAYRFLRTKYFQGLLSQISTEGEMPVKRDKLVSHLNDRGIEHSKQIERVDEYRSVILRVPSLGLSSKRKKVLRSLAADYAIPETGKTMHHMEKVTHIISAQESNMEKLTQMVGSIIREHGCEILPFEEHRDTENLIKDVESISRFKKEVSGIRAVIEMWDTYNGIRDKLVDTVGRLLFHQNQLNSDISIDKESLKGLKERKIEAREKWDEEELALNSQRAQLMGAHKQAKNNVDNLRKEYDSFEANDAGKKSSHFEQLKCYKQQAEKAQLDLEELDKEIKGIDGWHKGKLASITIDKDKIVQSISENILRLTENINTAESEVNEKKNQLTVECRDKEDDYRKKHKNDFDEIIHLIAKLDAKISISGYNEDEKNRIADIDREIEHRTFELEDLQKKQDRRQNAAAELKAKQDEANNIFSAAQAKLESSEVELERIRRLGNPSEGSLLKTLRDEHPEWVETIAKVVDPALLTKKDLSPIFTGNGRAIYGMEINLDAIAKPEFAASEEVFREQFQNQEFVVVANKESQDDAKKALKVTSVNIKQYEPNLIEIKNKVRNKINDINGLKKARTKVVDTIQDEINDRKKKFKVELKEKENQKNDLSMQLDNGISAIRKDYSLKIQELTNNQEREKSRINKRLDEQRSNKKEEEEKFEIAKIELKNEFNRRLKGQGVDDATLAKARQLRDEKQEWVDEVSSYAEIVQQYNDWLKYNWKNKEKYTDTLNDVSTKLKNKKDEISRKEKASTTKLKDFSTKIRETERLIDKKNEKLLQVTKAIDDIGFSSVVLIESHSQDIEFLITSAFDNQAELLDLKDEIMRGVDKAEKIITRNPLSQIAVQWNHIKNDTLGNSGGYSLSAENTIQLVPVIGELLSNTLPTIENNLTASLRSLCQQLTQYLKNLKDVKQSIGHISTTIGSTIQTDKYFPDIGSVELILESRIEKYESWQGLHELQQAIDVWNDAGAKAIPEMDLINPLASVLGTLRSARISPQIEDLFDLIVYIEENGNRVPVRTDKDFNNVSSTGLSILAQYCLFAGLTRYLCTDPDVQIHWPIDEIGKISNSNIANLFEMLKENNIIFVGVLPEAHRSVLAFFGQKHFIDKDKGVVHIDIPEDSLTLKLKQRLEGAEA